MKHIVHLDDHELITKGIATLLKKIFPTCIFHAYTDADKAWEFIESFILKGNKIDLVITDFIHPGPNGYEFATNIRALEIKTAVQPIPIVLLTMIDKTDRLIIKGLKTKIFTSYQSLAGPEEEILQTFRNLVAA